MSRGAVKAALERALRTAQSDMRVASVALQTGTMSIATWQVQMLKGIKDTHLYAAAMARGGWSQLTPADFGRAGRLIRDRYKFLNGFAAGIENGLPLSGRFLARSDMYLTGARTMQHIEERVEMRENQGMTEERNVLSVAENCGGCLDASSQSWVDIGSLPEIGSRDCLTHCLCEIEYR